MIQHQFEQSGNDLGKINNKISFHKGITQLCFPFVDDTSNTIFEYSCNQAFRERNGKRNIWKQQFRVDLEKMLIFKSK